MVDAHSHAGSICIFPLLVSRVSSWFSVMMRDRFSLVSSIALMSALISRASVRMLNLFAYTCSVSVAAAVGGAKQTTSVDLSNTYLDWGKRNYEANGVDPARHRFIRDDATRWMARDRNSYDWIFINPPTFSRSKMSKGDFNIHKDHTSLIENAMRSLDKNGELLFTTHARAFDLDESIRKRFRVEDATQRFVPPDFIRYPFQAFVLRR